MSTNQGTVSLTVDSRNVATLLVDRPGKLNALSLEMVEAMQECLAEVRRVNPQVVVLRSAGDRAFCVGADIKQFSSFDPVSMWSRWIAQGHRVFRELAELAQPTIAVVDGPAFGGGLELALCCDFLIASNAASFALPETGIGTIPGWGGTEALTRAVGRVRANELILARRTIDAETAAAWGLLNEHHPGEELDGAVDALVTELLGGAPLAQKTAKQLIRASTDGASAAVLEALASGFTAASPEFTEGLSAFVEKREPRFTTTQIANEPDQGKAAL